MEVPKERVYCWRVERREEWVVDRSTGGGVGEWKVLVVESYVRGTIRRIVVVVAWRKIFCLSSVGRRAKRGKANGAGVGGVMLGI